MAVVQRELLYEPPAAWMRERRPPSDYPVLLAHTGGDVLATAHGVYLGREASGQREGNHVTHAVIASGADAYGLVRPAQLLGASFWATEPAESTHIDTVDVLVSPGRLDIETVSERVRVHPDGVDLLAVLLTVVGGESPRRVLFIGDDTEGVLTWIAAATLLLPQSKAVGIGFKVFTTNPAQCRQQIVAVHADSGVTIPSPTANSGYVVVDLTRNTWSPVPAAPTAGAWANDFVTDDPYDVVESIEFAGSTGLRGSAARSVARAVVMNRPVEPDTATAVLKWLSTGPPKLLDAHGAIICDAFVEGAEELPVDLLTDLDRAVRDGRWRGRAVRVRHTLVAAELREAMAGEVAPPARAVLPPPREWTNQDQSQAIVTVVGALRKLGGTDIGAVDAVLRVAKYFNLDISSNEFESTAARFAEHWADHPDAAYKPALWPCGDDMVDALGAELSRRSRTEHDAARLARIWWVRLLPYVIDPRDRFAIAVVSTALQQMDNPTRKELITARLRSAANQPNAAQAVADTARLLWPDCSPPPAEARILLEFLPLGAGLSSGFFKPLVTDVSQIAKGQESLTVNRLDTGHALNRHGYIPSNWTKVLDLLRRDTDVTNLCRQLPSQGTADLDRTCLTLRQLDHRIVTVRHRQVVDGLLRNSNIVAVSNMLGAFDNQQVNFSYAGSLEQRMNGERAAVAAATAFLADYYISTPAILAETLWTILTLWRKKARPDVVDKAGRIVATYGEAEANAWRDSPMSLGRIQKITRMRPRPFKRD
jgi:hypothetical protein